MLCTQAATLLERLRADTGREGLYLTQPTYWADRIAPGAFSMGDSNGRYDDEKPQFDCPITQPYALARFPVTNGQYFRFVEALAGRGAPAVVAAARGVLPQLERHGQTVEAMRPKGYPYSAMPYTAMLSSASIAP